MSLATPAFFLRFDEAAGANNALDSSGNSRDFTQTNSPGSAAGVIGTARTCRVASAQFFSRANEAANSVGAGDMTLNFWVKLNSKPTFNDNVLVHKGAYPADWEVYYRASDDRLHFDAFKAGPTGFDTAESNAGALTLSTWYMVTLRRSGSTWSCQVNNGTPTTNTLAGDLADTGSAFYVGNDNASSLSDADFNLLGFWQESLSGADITTLYNSGAGYDPTAAAPGNPWHYYAQQQAVCG